LQYETSIVVYGMFFGGCGQGEVLRGGEGVGCHVAAATRVVVRILGARSLAHPGGRMTVPDAGRYSISSRTNKSMSSMKALEGSLRAERRKERISHFEAMDPGSMQRANRDRAQLRYFPLDSYEPDSVINFLHYLAARSPKSGRPCQAVRIPHTVFIAQGNIRAHYFSDAKGNIGRTPRESLTKEVIGQAFTQMRVHDQRYFPILVARDPDQEFQDAEHWTVTDAKAYFAQKKLTGSMVLQRFVKPFEPENNYLLAIWTENALHLERRSQFYKMVWGRLLGSDSFGSGAMSMRNVRHLSIKRNSRLARRIQEACDEIADHVTETSPQGYVIQKMELVFKMSDMGSLYLCWCNAVDVEQRTEVEKEATLNEFMRPEKENRARLRQRTKKLAATLRNDGTESVRRLSIFEQYYGALPLGQRERAPKWRTPSVASQYWSGSRPSTTSSLPTL